MEQVRRREGGLVGKSFPTTVGMAALWSAAVVGDLARVDSSITIARCSADGNTPLLRAAALKNVPAAEALMASCANPNDANY